MTIPWKPESVTIILDGFYGDSASGFEFCVIHPGVSFAVDLGRCVRVYLAAIVSISPFGMKRTPYMFPIQSW